MVMIESALLWMRRMADVGVSRHADSDSAAIGLEYWLYNI